MQASKETLSDKAVVKIASNSRIRTLIGLLLIIVLGFCVLCAFILAEARRNTWQRAAAAGTSLVAAIESDVSRNFRSIESALQAVVENLNDPIVSGLDEQTRRKIIFSRAALVQYLGTVMVFDESGNAMLDSRSDNVPQLNVVERDYFQIHIKNPNAGLYIGAPVISYVSKQWIVGVSRRLSHPDGSFAGVVMASLRLEYFQQLFQQTVLGANGNITLARNDGVILMRWPYREEFIGKNIRHAKLYKHLELSRAGQFETNAATDGVRRLVVYSQIGDLPLNVGIGQATDDIYASWRDFASGIAAVILLMIGMVVVLASYLIRELKRRERTEAALIVRATTDGLSRLYNHRYFTECLNKEWKRAVRGQLQLSLILFDVDDFKIYNDTLGHLAGDALIKTIGNALRDSAHRAGDFGARLGGDEFAVLLPDTSAEGAKRVMEALRLRLQELCEKGGIAIVGLSVGIACFTPEPGTSQKLLLETADHALYEAKRLGRNRTQVAKDNVSNFKRTAAPEKSRAA
jgi:diguanylate cyclase (GGDEF)-like protein